jgi:hypothetical protein
MHITSEHIQILGSEKSAEAMKTIRDSKNDDIRALKQKLKTYESNCVEADTAMEVEDQDDMEILQKITRDALPIAEKVFG